MNGQLFNFLRNKPKVSSNNISFILRNNDCRALLDDFTKSDDAQKVISLVLAYELETKKKDKFGQVILEGFHLTAGIGPNEVQRLADSLHHRVQHEGVPGYD